MQDCELIGAEITRITNTTGTPPLDIDKVRELKATINVKTSAFDIAAITSNSVTGDRIITYKLKNCTKAQFIPSTDPYYETLSYPLLFAHAERGWGCDIAKQISFMKYLCARMLAPENASDGEPLYCWNKPREGHIRRLLRVNRMMLFARVAQLYLVDQVSRSIDFKLNWQRMNKDYMFSGSRAPQGLEALSNNNNNNNNNNDGEHEGVQQTAALEAETTLPSPNLATQQVNNTFVIFLLNCVSCLL